MNKKELYTACLEGDVFSLRKAVDSGIDLNSIKYHNSPLLHAAIYGSDKNNVVKFLLENGVDVNSSNQRKETALDLIGIESFAVSDSKEYLIRVNLLTVKLLIKYGANVNNKEAPTPALIGAVHKNSIDIADLLLQNGADVNIRDETNQTPIMVAHSKELVELLLSHNADVNLQDRNGDSALRIYRAFPEPEKLNIIKLLLKAGADINHSNLRGETILDFAIDYNESSELIEFIQNNGGEKGDGISRKIDGEILGGEE
jgi:ankyrin repeat protein